MLRFLRILLILLVLVVGGAIAAFYLAPSSMIAGMIADRAKTATGRDLTIAGDIERGLFPNLRVKISDVSLSNADWAENDMLFSADSIEIAVNTMSLIGGAVIVETLAIDKPQTWLEVDENGRQSWVFASAKENQGGGSSSGGDGHRGHGHGGGGGMDLAVIDARLTDGMITYLDRGAGERLEVTEIEATASAAALDKTFTLDGGALIAGKRATLSGALDSIAKIQAGDKAVADLKFGAPGVEFAFDGEFATPSEDQPPQAVGNLALTVSGDREETAWLRTALPKELSELGAINLKGDVNASPSALDVSLKGDGDLKGVATELAASIIAGPGWSAGETPADIDVALRNEFANVSYVGEAGMRPGQLPTAKGKAVIVAPNIAALFNWAEITPPEDTPLALLDSVDLTGDIVFDDSQANAELEGEVGYNGRHLALAVDVKGGADWADGGEIATSLDARAPDLFEASWTGDVRLGEEQPHVNGDLTFASSALRALADWVGARPLEAPQGTFETIDISTALAYGPDAVSLKSAEIKLDDTMVAGDVDVVFSERRPKVTAALVTGLLDLRPFTQGGAGGATATNGGGAASGATSGAANEKATAGWSDEPLELSVLRLVDVDLRVTTDGLITNVLRVGPSVINSLLDDGRLTIKIPRMALYGGAAKGGLIVDARDTPSIGVDVEMIGVQIQPLLADSADLNALAGVGAVSLDINGSGVSIKRIMRSLAGDASVKLTDGAIIGYNLAALARNFTSFGGGSNEVQKTDFAELSATFQITNGVASNPDLLMLGPLIRLTGAGEIDIGAQTLNYRLEPKAVASLQGQGGDAGAAGLTFPLIVQGPWANPSITPDLAAGLQNLDQILENPDAIIDQLESLGDGLGESLGGGLGESLGGGDLKPDKLLKGLFGD